MKAVKKPIIIDFEFAEEDGEVEALGGKVSYKKGDAIITGVAGERYPCRRDIFDQTYSVVDSHPEMRTESTPDEAYFDRNQAFQAMAVMARKLGYGVGTITEDPQWPTLYIDLPTGQVSAHIPKDELLSVFSPYSGQWDGTGVEEKRERMKDYILDVKQIKPRRGWRR